MLVDHGQKRLFKGLFLLGIIFQKILHTLAASHKFSRKLLIRSVYGTAASIRILYTLAIFLNFADVFIFQEILGQFIRLFFGAAHVYGLFSRNFFPKTFCCQIIFQKIFQEIFQEIFLRLKKIVGIKTKIYLKSKQKNLYIYVYVLRIRIYIHILIHKETNVVSSACRS